MLILTRRIGEKIVIGDNVVEVAVLSLQGNQVRIGITAPKDVTIHRQEIYEKIQEEKKLKQVETDPKHKTSIASSIARHLIGGGCGQLQ